MPTRPPFRSAIADTALRIGILSTYPPQLCGLATFASALGGALRRQGNHVDVVRIDDGEQAPSVPPTMVVADLVNGNPASVRAAAIALSRCDVAIIQHEYGIFGGPDGDEVLALMDLIDVPTIVVLHTVPLVPSAHQRWVLESVAQRADRLVVMSAAARDRLARLYRIDPDLVSTIPHGAATAAPRRSFMVGVDEIAAERDHEGEAPQLLTWGLLGPGKGIEHVIDAMAILGDLDDAPRYTVTGVTHPKVFACFGDVYRRSLIDRAVANGTADRVVFDDRYRDVAQLTRYIASASVVVLPYDSIDQVTSGVLVDALAAGRPVIATAFPHAVELITGGAGITVPHGDPVALADAIRAVVTDDALRETMVAAARALAPSLSWTSVAGRYVDLATATIAEVDRLSGDDRAAVAM